MTFRTLDDAGGSARATGWVALARLLVIAVFAQSIFAGLLLSGEQWGRTAHSVTAYGLVAVAPLAAVMAAATMRHVAAGRRLAGLLALLAAGLAGQMIVGMLSADGERLMWIHVPLGVILVGLAVELPGAAQGLAKSRGTRSA